MSPFGPRPPPPARVPDSSPAPPPAPNHASNPCDKVPGLWLVKVGADTSRVLEGRFIIEPGFAAIWDIASPPCVPFLLLPIHFGCSPSCRPFSARRPVNSKISVSLLCLSTAALTALYISLKPSNPSAESIATAVAKLETAWPQDGTLFLDINKEREGSGGKTWLPFDVDPTSPLDVTEHMQPGPNVIRFIQLTNMEHHTFILYASRPEHTDTPLRDTPPPPNNLNPLFNFHSRTGGS
ncbi:hypothetical protein DFH07DRAFT_739878 [Mycena maculata]|uniref:Uncharacterized protein n=1 Tax=Mycena maculata TaxID=230809 RepID=A0AAD7NIW7_9AGAR|nr:hypothetical protein DFH07DRAFT_739878 [Mycena maculata]